MSALPTSLTKPEPRTKTKAAATKNPAAALSTLKPIGATESLSKKSRAELFDAPATSTTPAGPSSRRLRAGARLLRCTVHIFQHHTAWQAACDKRSTPGVGCACEDAPDVDSQVPA